MRIIEPTRSDLHHSRQFLASLLWGDPKRQWSHSVLMADKVQRLSDLGSKMLRGHLSWRRVADHLDPWIRDLASLAGSVDSEIEGVRNDLSSIATKAASPTHPDLSPGSRRYSTPCGAKSGCGRSRIAPMLR